MTLPFTNRFGAVSGFQKGVYALTLVAAAAATAFLIAPVSYHRIVFREGRKPQLVRAASVLAAVGLGFLLVAMLGSVYLVTGVVLGAPAGAAVLGALALLYGFLWYALPFLHRR